MAKWSEWKPAENWPETEVTFKKKYRLDDGNGGGGGIARIAINRPEVLNAMAGYHMGWLAEGVRRASADPSIGVIVIAGEGAHFGTGGDVNWEAQGGLRPESQRTGPGGFPNTEVVNSLKPVIAMVQGYAIGAHHHLHYHCDLTIAADNAIFGQNGPRVASPINGEVVSNLGKIIGNRRAKEIYMLCRQYTAQQALDWGLVNAVVPLEHLEAEVERWCDELLNIMPECLSFIKQSFNPNPSLVGLIAPDFHDRPGVKEAQGAFFDRRIPNFWKGTVPEGIA